MQPHVRVGLVGIAALSMAGTLTGLAMNAATGFIVTGTHPVEEAAQLQQLLDYRLMLMPAVAAMQLPFWWAFGWSHRGRLATAAYETLRVALLASLVARYFARSDVYTAETVVILQATETAGWISWFAALLWLSRHWLRVRPAAAWFAAAACSGTALSILLGAVPMYAGVFYIVATLLVAPTYVFAASVMAYAGATGDGRSTDPTP